MRRLSISDIEMFIPKEGEIFFAEVPNKGIDRKVKTMVSKSIDSCENCVFCRGELNQLCWGVLCTEGHKEYTFRRVSDGKV